MPPKVKQTKEAIAKAAAAGGRSKKKKWSKGKTREKLSQAVVLDKATYDKIAKEVPQWKLITASVVSERLKVNGSVARRLLVDLAEKKLIKCVSRHSSQYIYTRAVATA